MKPNFRLHVDRGVSLPKSTVSWRISGRQVLRPEQSHLRWKDPHARPTPHRRSPGTAGGPQGQEGSAQLCTHQPCWLTKRNDPPPSCASSTKHIQIPTLGNALNKSIKYSFRISHRPSLESYFNCNSESEDAKPHGILSILNTDS